MKLRLKGVWGLLLSALSDEGYTCSEYTEGLVVKQLSSLSAFNSQLALKDYRLDIGQNIEKVSNIREVLQPIRF